MSELLTAVNALLVCISQNSKVDEAVFRSDFFDRMRTHIVRSGRKSGGQLTSEVGHVTIATLFVRSSTVLT